MRTRLTVLLFVTFCSIAPSVLAQSAQAGLAPSGVREFLGTWSIDMTNPAGAHETVKIWEEGGTVRASLQLGRFPASPVTAMMRDGDALILSFARRENGAPIRCVASLTIEGDTIAMAQLLSQSETVKRGTGKRAE